MASGFHSNPSSRWRAIPLASLCLLVLSGCTTFGFDVRGFPNPVLVSPVLRVGDAGPTEITGSSIGSVRGEASTSSAAGAGTHYEQRGGDVYRVEQSAYGSETRDDIFHSLADATGGRRDLIVVIDELRAADLTHMSMIGYAAMEVSIEGRVFEASALAPREEQP